MIINRQLLINIAVWLTFFFGTIAILQWRHVEPPPPRMLLIPGTLVQIEVPLGLLPVPDLLNPAFGMDGDRVAWIDASAADDLSLIFTGTPPEAWPLPDDEAARNARARVVVNPSSPVLEPGLHGVLAIELDTGPESVRIR